MDQLKKRLLKFLEKENAADRESISINMLKKAGISSNGNAYNTVQDILNSQDSNSNSDESFATLTVGTTDIPEQPRESWHDSITEMKESESEIKQPESASETNATNSSWPEELSKKRFDPIAPPQNTAYPTYELKDLPNCHKSGFQFNSYFNLSERFEIMCILGQGGCGQVYYAFDTKTNKHVIIKSNLSKLRFCSINTTPISNEIKILQTLHKKDKHCKHHFIPCYIDSFTDTDNTLYLVTEAFIDTTTNLPAKDLGKHLQTTNITLRDRLNVYLKILKAVKYLDDIGIKHKDLKPENILVDSNFDQIQIIDFGTACYKKEKECYGGFTPSYQPAGHKHKKEYKDISELYSLIIILGDLLYAKHFDIIPPNKEMSLNKLVKDFVIGKRVSQSTLLTFYHFLLSHCQGSQSCNNQINLKKLIKIFKTIVNNLE